MRRQYTSKKPKNLRYTLSRFAGYLRHQSFLLLLVIVLVLGAVSADLFGTYMIRPIVNGILAGGGMPELVGKVIIVASFYIIGVIFSLLYSQIIAVVAQRFAKDLRGDLFSHLETLPLSFFDKWKHGDVMSLFTNDVDTVLDAMNNSFAAVAKSFVQIVGTMTLIIILNWRLSLIVAISYLFMILYIRYSGKRSKAYYNKMQKTLGELDGYVQEMVTGQKVVKIFSHEEENVRKFSERNKRLMDAGYGAQRYAASMVPAVVTISYVNYAIVAFVGGVMVMKGWMDLGSLASYLVFVRQCAAPINNFTNQMNFLFSALAGAERIFNVLDEKSEIDNGSVTLEKEKDGWCWVKDDERIPLCGDVRFEDVVFGYTEERKILDGISLYAKPGQMIALVGSTGAGKTTITGLINRFYEIQSGRILFDGIDIREIKKRDLRHSFAYVLQDTHLFTATIRENIRFGRLDATDDDVVKAAKIANADSFIRRLPDGYDTMIRNDGANLSEGQRQLIAIARAAVADPPVLVLDEATSSIDTRTEDLIEKGMDSLMEGRTVFVIAHRLSTVRNADAILVIEDGHIVERGDHDDLMAMKGRYYSLYMGMFELS